MIVRCGRVKNYFGLRSNFTTTKGVKNIIYVCLLLVHLHYTTNYIEDKYMEILIEFYICCVCSARIGEREFVRNDGACNKCWEK